MAIRTEFKVIPGPPDVPTSVEIICTGLDNTKQVELLTNGKVRSTISVANDKSLNSTFTISTGAIRGNLVDIGSGHSEVKEVGRDGVLLRVSTGFDDSLELRYKS